MTKQITLEEALKLVTFYRNYDGTWHVQDVEGCVEGNVCGDVYGDVEGNVNGRQ